MMKKDKIFCLYFHLRKGTSIVFYIGIGGKKRPYDKKQRSKIWHDEVNKYGYDIVIKFVNITKKNACKLEIAWIKKIGRRDKGLGTLVNLTNGGEGNAGTIFTEVRKKNISLSL